MKKLAIIILCFIALTSCVTSNQCPTKTDANGAKYLDKNDCVQKTYLVGLIPIG
ncbi:hypothetical protein IB642_01315 [Allofrancisella guangzhouensis]|uniref:hypothetical protein n=1 Tax=Allofrancisella guangzhouensis TaxID=594679 RepID=UPI000AD96953|nr:hypothetical protein [Allofrancisella guangzhouensis]MBK2026733.1 hypothetical protein [Allofrancisella guangzhouensis]MBK2043658.1 hypothetical protein [Allofrancisella guangzhouensis]MBK2046187.1 hypothetical protein [Allofrancisella guangzhouensis]